MKQNFWITNISNRNVSLSDLNLTIKAYSSINLMDSKHYNYSIEQINKSVLNGSIYNKRNKIFVRKVAPVPIKNNIKFERETFVPSREKSLYNIKEEHYEELEISDEDFAKENADTAQIDANTQIISKG
ncbi:hypothetical protein UFOVP1290_644 [uncultured Caudovirales phage]|uniref:Uncharacterized protein n=1 Tax=uncultured Caudovirales phage TaxID=2100421 RepID=A0A6J5RYD0_9CAUD|nr:hypothetical protein UFOVP1290_644 [uncultured Caudovirales phage]